MEVTSKLSQHAKSPNAVNLWISPLGEMTFFFFFFLKCLLEISKSKLDFQAPFIALVSVKAKTVLHSILENVHNFGRREQIILVNKSHYLRARFVCPHLHSRLGNGLSLDDKKKIEAHS